MKSKSHRWLTMLWEFKLYQEELFCFLNRVLDIKLVGIREKSIYIYLFYCFLISIFPFVPEKAMVDQNQPNKQINKQKISPKFSLVTTCVYCSDQYYCWELKSSHHYEIPYCNILTIA